MNYTQLNLKIGVRQPRSFHASALVLVQIQFLSSIGIVKVYTLFSLLIFSFTCLIKPMQESSNISRTKLKAPPT